MIPIILFIINKAILEHLKLVPISLSLVKKYENEKAVELIYGSIFEVICFLIFDK